MEDTHTHTQRARERERERERMRERESVPSVRVSEAILARSRELSLFYVILRHQI